MTTHRVLAPRARRNTLRTRTVAALATTLVTALVLVGCGGDDSVDPPSTGSAATTGQDTASPDTDVPQVGSGTGLADTDYAELNQDALTTGLDARDVDDHDPANTLSRHQFH